MKYTPIGHNEKPAGRAGVGQHLGWRTGLEADFCGNLLHRIQADGNKLVQIEP